MSDRKKKSGWERLKDCKRQKLQESATSTMPISTFFHPVSNSKSTNSPLLTNTGSNSMSDALLTTPTPPVSTNSPPISNVPTNSMSYTRSTTETSPIAINPVNSMSDTSLSIHSPSVSSVSESPVTINALFVPDVGLYYTSRTAINSLSDIEKYTLLTNHVCPPQTEMLTKKLEKGKEKRIVTLRFQTSWIDKNKWLVYSPAAQGGLCIYCVLFGQTAVTDTKTQANKFVASPFTNLKDALEEFKNHEKTKYHNDACVSAANFKLTHKNTDKNIAAQLNDQIKKNYEENVSIISTVVELVMFCASQGISLRGHRNESGELDPTVNSGNFLALAHLRAQTDYIFREHLNSRQLHKNSMHTSWQVQNEIINIIEKCVKSKIKDELEAGECHFFSIMSDTVTDQFSNQEVLSLCLRYVNERHEIKERFFDFVYLPERATGKSMSDQIKLILSKANLDITKLRGQSYDGASSMSSENVGVQKFIKESSPLAIYTHCHSHILNLCIASVSKIPEIRNLIDSINVLFQFFKQSPKRQRFFEKVLSHLAPESKKTRLLGLCKTRWVERHDCFNTLYLIFPFVTLTLKAIFTSEDIFEDNSDDWCWDAETKIKAQGLYSTFTSFGTICSFVICLNVLNSGTLEALSSRLQKRDQDIFKALSLIQCAKDELRQFRIDIDNVYKDWFEQSCSLAQKVTEGFEPTIPRQVGRQKHRFALFCFRICKDNYFLNFDRQ